MDGEPPPISESSLTGKTANAEPQKTPESVPFNKAIDFLGDANTELDTKVTRWQEFIDEIEGKQAKRKGFVGTLSNIFNPLDASEYKKELEGVQGEKRAVTSAVLRIASGETEEAKTVITKMVNRSLQGLGPSLFGEEDRVVREFRLKMIERAQEGTEALRQIDPKEAERLDGIIKKVSTVNSFMSGPEIVE